MQFEAKSEDFGWAEILRNFDENGERNLRIYESQFPNQIWYKKSRQK